MLHRTSLTGILSLSMVSAVFGQQASPVHCRDALRPVLLQAEPDRELLPEIQRLCAAQAEAGDADALYHLSLLHLGLVDWQPDRAATMIRRAAVGGVAEAQYWLAWQYDAGPLLDDEAGAALYWYGQAGEREHRLALERLAEIYARGELGMPVDARRAGEYRARAARCGD